MPLARSIERVNTGVPRTAVFRVTESAPRSLPSKLATEPQKQPLVVAWGDQSPARRMLEVVLYDVVPATGLQLKHIEFDLSEKSRKADSDVIGATASEMENVGFGVKSATVGPEDKAGYGLPNANVLLRRETGATAIVRTIRPFRPVEGLNGEQRKGLTVVRYADHDAEEYPRGSGEGRKFVRIEILSARTSRLVADHAFAIADQIQNPPNPFETPGPAKVLYGSRFSNYAAYKLFDEAVEAAYNKHRMQAAHRQRRPIDLETMTADDLYARLHEPDGSNWVIPATEGPGDILSQFAIGLNRVPRGSVPSMTLSLDRPRIVVWTDQVHGLVRRLEHGDDWEQANPVATILAVADVLYSMSDNTEAQLAGYTMREATHRIASDPDGPPLTTTAFVDALKGEL